MNESRDMRDNETRKRTVTDVIATATIVICRSQTPKTIKTAEFCHGTINEFAVQPSNSRITGEKGVECSTRRNHDC